MALSMSGGDIDAAIRSLTKAAMSQPELIGMA
jgi:hypothetical protein